MRGLVFDLDGTLADTLATIAAAVNHGLGRLGLPERGLDEVRAMVGEGVGILCEKALPPERADEAERLSGYVREFYEEHPMLHCRLFEGMEATVRALRADGLRLAVLSNKPHSLVRKTVDGLGIADCFDIVLGHVDERPRKPDPTTLLGILGGLGLGTDEILYVGDTPIDMETARRAGVPKVAVTWGFRPLEELLPWGPDHVVRRPTEILELARRSCGGNGDPGKGPPSRGR